MQRGAESNLAPSLYACIRNSQTYKLYVVLPSGYHGLLRSCRGEGRIAGVVSKRRTEETAGGRAWLRPSVCVKAIGTR